MDERKQLIDEIERWVEYNPNPYARIAFYSDRDVERVLMDLYRRWEEAGCKGAPVDYASLDELRFLAFKARQYRNADASVMLGLAMGLDVYGVEKREDINRGVLTKLIRMFKKLFGKSTP